MRYMNFPHFYAAGARPSPRVFLRILCEFSRKLPCRLKQCVYAILFAFAFVSKRRLRARPFAREREINFGPFQEVGFVRRTPSKRKGASPCESHPSTIQVTFYASTAPRSTQDRF